MARPDTPQLTELQLAILRVLWQRGELPVTQVHAALVPERELAPTTVATLLKRLERRGVVSHRKLGRQFLYSATISEEQATHSMLNEVAERLFDGDLPAMLAQLLTARDVRPGDLERIRALLEEKQRELEG